MDTKPLLRPLRFRFTSAFALPPLALAAALGVSACSATSDDAGRTSRGPVTDVPQASVKDQSIGNCWTYATVGWIESLVKGANDRHTELTLSESYVTYWYWYEQIAGGRVGAAVQEGGTWAKAIELVLRYGIPDAGDFIAPEATAIRSARQETALAAINLALKSGALKDRAAQRDRALVRREMDRAWQLGPKVSAWMDTAFGADVSTTLDGADPTTALAAGVPLHRASDMAAKLKDPDSGEWKTATVADAMGTRRSRWDIYTRSGALAWQTASYPDASDAKGRRDFLKRVQRALHDHQPVVLSWYVDFNALDDKGRFFAPPATPGSQGGHMVIMEDYEIDNVPGFGTLAAGVNETRPEALQAALADEATVKFLRIKNSWGNYHSPTIAGYHDLYMTYLNGPLKQCETDASEHPILDKCHDAVPLEDVVLPAGY